MNPITGWITAGAFLIMFCGVFYGYIVKARNDKEEKKRLEEELSKKQELITELYKHSDEITKIRKTQSQIDQKINEAKTDEEISNIISGILAANNDRVRK